MSGEGWVCSKFVQNTPQTCAPESKVRRRQTGTIHIGQKECLNQHNARAFELKTRNGILCPTNKVNLVPSRTHPWSITHPGAALNWLLEGSFQCSNIDSRITECFSHTPKFHPLRGRGLGTKLTHAALEYVRQNGLGVVAIARL